MRDNALCTAQAAFLAHLREGGSWVGGGAVIIADTIECWPPASAAALPEPTASSKY